MSSRYNFEAQRSQDVLVIPHRKNPKTKTEDIIQPNPWKPDVSEISNKAPKVPQRVINLCLDSAQATNITTDTITWNLSLTNVGRIAKGTILYINNVATNAAYPGEYAFSGIASETFGDTLKAYFEQRANVVLTPVSNMPVCVSIKDPSCLLNNMMTFRRTNAVGAPSFTGTQNFYLKVFLTLVEPGANFP